MEELSALLNEICSQAPIYQPISMRAFDARLQGVEITDGGTIFWQNVSWGE